MFPSSISSAPAAPPRTRRWWALALIAAAQFMVIMDKSIIGIALPRMQADLGFSQENLSWVFNAYVIAFGGLLLLGGRLSDLFGARRLFTTGWIILAIGSLVAGLAGQAWVELLGRAAQDDRHRARRARTRDDRARARPPRRQLRSRLR